MILPLDRRRPTRGGLVHPVADLPSDDPGFGREGPVQDPDLQREEARFRKSSGEQNEKPVAVGIHRAAFAGLRAIFVATVESFVESGY